MSLQAAVFNDRQLNESAQLAWLQRSLAGNMLSSKLNYAFVCG